MWLGFFAWYRGLALGGVMRVSQVQLLQPFLALLFAALLLGEALRPTTVGFALAVIGTVLFFADGLIALAIFPALADAAPDLLEVTGAMNTGGVLIAFIVIAATAMIGYVVFGVALWRAGVLSRGAILLFLLGGILFNLPPGPVPMWVLTVGGVVWAAGALWLAVDLLKVKGNNV